ncbi:MAG: hypothetical protein AAGH48_02750 [Pseudomonadota bacterium]
MLDIVLAPHISVSLLISLAIAVASLTAFGLWRRARGALWRSAAGVAALAALSNPQLRQTERDPVNDIAALVIDRSDSQNLGGRPEALAEITNQLRAALEADETLDLRIVDAPQTPDGTLLQPALDAAFADAPRARIAGAVIVTDGQAHDAPLIGADELGAPIHMILTGTDNEVDRRLIIESAPRYGIVGEQVDIVLKVEDRGRASADGEVDIAAASVWRDGAFLGRWPLRPGASMRRSVTVEHGGPNVIEIEVAPLEGELTTLNNRAALSINGVRDRLKVLLVSGEPHAGERAWRNLLKADPSVDLVHFTILRPPEKQDGTPIDELSLIAFPTRQLFQEKLSDFDLIIFDRYRLRGVLPFIYFANIARFVEEGGAVLVAAGPSFAHPYFSLARTPLSSFLPARPTGEVIEAAFRPHLTGLGFRHPVTAKLPQANSPPAANGAGGAADARWGRWFRQIASDPISGQTLMAGSEAAPLLILDRFGEGRVAQLMSDHSWLWSRGVEGGGPQAELLRRLAHWLMKEPDLEEEDLRAEVRGDRLILNRRTMGESVPPAEVTAPSGAVSRADFAEVGPGLWRAETTAPESGLYRISNGALTAVAASGPVNPVEFADVISTDRKLAPSAAATGGGVFWPARYGAAELPTIRRVRAGRDAFGTAGRGWLGLIERNTYKTVSLSLTPLASPWVWLLVVGGVLAAAWRSESR